MESMTMTNATRITRDRSACPLTDGAFLVGDAALAPRQGTAVSAFGFGIGGGIATDRLVVAYVPARKPSTTDVVRSHAWRPPV